jgi:hypothetical protein
MASALAIISAFAAVTQVSPQSADPLFGLPQESVKHPQDH